uniref:leucine--tRNA ligase n=1 Tax=Cajanus cajan TaxID=3821 RepID=A0A151TJE3_CAJCA|nr:Leucyl-tRNA synthetase, cytoplasmic [Cajanus cajan]
MASEGGKSFARRDRLREIESKVQKWWEEKEVFRAEPGEKPPSPGEKFFGNFPFPYMNGYLHLGHAFSLSKLEFAAAFHRLRGANVLLPFAFHCTGMPIKASADKLAREIAQFGDPPVYQWEILRSVGISDAEISKFQDPYKWLSYFPPLAVEDLKAFGLGCDWRRSFITTDMNPYFDSFVRWQMRKLKSMGKVVKDVRYTVFSPLDGQPCADHDRASGEGVQPQEYTIIKMDEVFVVAHRAALNLAYQNHSRVPEKPSCLLELTGRDLIGLPLKSPLSVNEVIYALPMLSILMDKGTGVVTSVPSDAPDDYMALHDLKAKPAFREKYGVKDEWVMPFEIQTYLKGFTEGTMIVGEFAGRKVQEAKPLIRNKLLETGQAIVYSEPEKRVMSRSGDECVVALTDQWYITYGESEWRKLAEECLSNMSLYSDETQHGFEHTLGWLNQWACSRSFGLGTRIPWDEQFLVEMKREFEYWYPFDLRKMSKSTGNFRTLRQAIEEFSADATRFSLADAGDGVDDANFVFETANAAILRLTKEIAWYEDNLAAESSMRTGPPSTYADRVFANEINIAVKTTEQNYSNYMFREALKSGFYDLQTARDEYRFSCGVGGYNRDLVWRFMDVQTRLIAPICPHYAEFIWRELLKKDGFVVNAGWPTAEAPDLTLKSANKYLQDSIVLMRKLLQKQLSGSKKGNKKAPPVASPAENKVTGLIYVNEQFDGWKAECLSILQNKFNRDTRSFAPDSEILEALQKSSVGQSSNFKQIQKLCMPFLRFKKEEAIALGAQALDLRLPFGEIEVLKENLDLIKRQIGLEDVEILSAADADSLARAGSLASLLNQNPPSPGNPTAIFLTQ